MSSYALMRHSVDLESFWVTSPSYLSYKEYADALRRALSLGDVSQYRGIGRFPLTEYHEVGPGWKGYEDNQLADPEPEARSLLLAALGPYDYYTSWPRAFVPTLQEAVRIWQALQAPWQYEIVELCEPGEQAGHLIGYDLGYWGGGNYSILCDAAIWPTWHGPDPEAWEELALFVKRLNNSLLFESEKDAQEYLDWYSLQDWAEKEPTDFTIIGIGVVDVVS